MLHAFNFSSGRAAVGCETKEVDRLGRSRGAGAEEASYGITEPNSCNSGLWTLLRIGAALNLLG